MYSHETLAKLQQKLQKHLSQRTTPNNLTEEDRIIMRGILAKECLSKVESCIDVPRKKEATICNQDKERWRSIKQRMRECTCDICNSSEGIELHERWKYYMRGNTIYKELYDIQPLCSKHHTLQHERRFDYELKHGTWNSEGYTTQKTEALQCAKITDMKSTKDYDLFYHKLSTARSEADNTLTAEEHRTLIKIKMVLSNYYNRAYENGATLRLVYSELENIIERRTNK